MTPRDFKPLNPWGRPMPAPPRPIRTAPEPLYQVQVEDCATGRPMMIGPQMVGNAAGQLCEAINRKIAAGQEKAWANAHVVPVSILNS